MNEWRRNGDICRLSRCACLNWKPRPCINSRHLNGFIAYIDVILFNTLNTVTQNRPRGLCCLNIRKINTQRLQTQRHRSMTHLWRRRPRSGVVTWLLAWWSEALKHLAAILCLERFILWASCPLVPFHHNRGEKAATAAGARERTVRRMWRQLGWELENRQFQLAVS